MFKQSLKHPTFETTLPISGETVTFRPFTVGEMKTLMIQAESKTEGGKVDVTIDNCCLSHSSDDFDQQADKEFLFLQIRAKSVAEGIDLAHACSACGERNVFTLNFETDLNVLGEKRNNIVTVRDDVILQLKRPQTRLLKALQNEKTEENLNAVIVDCIDTLTYGEEVVVAADIPKDEIMEFVADLTQKDFNKIEDWVLKQPRLYSESTYECKKCDATNKVTVTGLLSFF
jgi:hypothetical protein